MRVLGHGPKDARIVFVGEAPGETEEREGLPFVGGSGQLFTQMCSAVGIDRNACYITNVVKDRPARNEFDQFYLDKKRQVPSEYLKQSITELHEEIRALPNRTVICPMGGEALKAITGRNGITNWRGSILSSPLGKVVPTLHPAYILRQYGDRPIVELDLRRVLQESQSPQIDVRKVNCLINPSYAQVMDYIQRANNAKRLSFDIETTGPLTRCLGLSVSVDEAISIPFISSVPPVGPSSNVLLFAEHKQGLSKQHHWSEQEELSIIRALYSLFANSSVQKIGQNLPFDVVVLAKEFGFFFSNVHMDTMLAHHTCYCELPKGLDFLASIYTRLPYYSDYDPADDRATWIYNCHDAAVTLEISERLDQELAQHGLSEFYHNHLHPAMLALTRAETRGILVDNVQRINLTETTRTETEAIRKEIAAVAGRPDFNPGSSKQLQEFLYGKLKLPVQRHYKTKNPTADKNALEALAKKHPEVESILNSILEYSKKSTLLSNFLDKPLGRDGRIRTHYNPGGTVTGRLSSAEPLFDVGTNLQNIPRGEFRRMFIADPGWVLIKSDLSQAEFRIVVWLAKIERIISRYINDPTFDVHKWNAGENIFRVPIDQVTKAQRKVAKDGVYGGNYGMHFKRAAIVYKMPVEMAQLVLTRYLQAVPEIPQWWQTVQATINSTRTIISPLGRKRIFFGRLDDEIYRQAYSHSAQSIVADIIDRAFALPDDLFDESECFPLLQVHDEIVFACRAGLEHKYVPLVKKVMEYPIRIEGVDVPLVIPSETTVGPNWYDQKELEHVKSITNTDTVSGHL